VVIFIAENNRQVEIKFFRSMYMFKRFHLVCILTLVIMCIFPFVSIFAQDTSREQMMKNLAVMMRQQKMQGMNNSSDINLPELKKKFQNAIVKIEFTAIINKEETRMNPTKSERYYSGQEPPHGTGFFISESEILTNAHVVEEARKGTIRVKSPATGNVEFKVEIVGIDGAEQIDLAVLRLPEDEILRFKKRSGLDKIPFIEFGDSDSVKQADALAVFGYPQSSDELKIIQAKVTGRQYLKISLGRFVCGHQFLEVGPAGVVQPGNSGGPALNFDGKVVGIPSRGSGWASEQGWLIPSNIVLHFLERIKNNESGKKSIELPKLGISITENFPGTSVWTDAPEDCVIFELGVVVREVTPKSLADKWGIKSKDIIVGFANKEKNISCALDFEGYRVITGKMKDWPRDKEITDDKKEGEIEKAKLHLSELVISADVGDEITLWYVRKGKKGIKKITKKMEYRQPVPLPHLGTFNKPDYELWGDFVAQDFNDYNTSLFEVPVKEVLKGGVLVTFVEPNSLASRRGMKPSHRSTFGFAFRMGYQPVTSWVIIESVNDKSVKNLAELKEELRKAEGKFDKKKKSPDYKPVNRILMKERYCKIGFRTNMFEGNVLHQEPAFPIDEALEFRDK
jgi:S1-C subfamily serine protease